MQRDTLTVAQARIKNVHKVLMFEDALMRVKFHCDLAMANKDWVTMSLWGIAYVRLLDVTIDL